MSQGTRHASSSWSRMKSMAFDHSQPPIGLRWRSSSLFVLSTVGIGGFTDIFLYGLIVPVLPFMLNDRVHVPASDIQTSISNLLAIFAAASCISSPIAGILGDQLSSSRQLPFLLGLVFLLLATILLAIGNTIFVLGIARLLQGASGAFVWAIGLALLVDTVGPENLGKAVGTVFSLTSVASLFSPVIGGSLYAKTGYTGVFAVSLALITVDFIMRLFVIEKRIAAQYTPQASPDLQASGGTNSDPSDETPLLAQDTTTATTNLAPYRLPEPQQAITRMFPILLTLRDPALLTAFWIGFIQAVLLGAFDATVPLVASSRYGFDSLKAGLLFLPLGGANFFFGPIFGWCIDKWGTKIISVLGFTSLVPVLILLRIPTEVSTGLEQSHQIALYACLLGLCGLGLAIINSPSIVEAGNVLDKYWRANRGLFANRAPYAQLYGLNSMMWCAGLTAGPLMAGSLRVSIGYGNMNAVLAGVCGVTAVLAALFIGRKDNMTEGVGAD
ncbi:MFS general substrate transporter [Amniculicola lignicola CBS 123094]|uniref:MFS general substrate transporter n=1 Tax=Amniculicola lignicola CBS 123094 TaxID=1392246 RepID=A0A6A5VYK2_9PLEO|nr:MFS general substrate transporter [Amniculicola lignicola CBS 123094]